MDTSEKSELTNLDELPKRQKPNLNKIEKQLIKELGLNKVNHNLNRNEHEDCIRQDFFKETNIQIMDELSPSLPIKKKINVSEFLTGGGLAQYHQSPNITTRSGKSKHMNMVNSTPKVAST